MYNIFKIEENINVTSQATSRPPLHSNFCGF